MNNVDTERNNFFWNMCTSTAIAPLPLALINNSQAANYEAKTESNLEHRTRILAELAAQGFVPIKQKKPKYLERYFCFYSRNKAQNHKKTPSVTPVSSEDDMNDAMFSVTL